MIGDHYLFFADELGIASVFPILKDRLAEPRYLHVSLMYCSANCGYVFQKELEILQKHFPTRLFVSYQPASPAGNCMFKQDEIEAVLNANTMRQMNFIISGDAVFVEMIGETLIFLGVDNAQIQKQYFSEL